MTKNVNLTKNTVRSKSVESFTSFGSFLDGFIWILSRWIYSQETTILTYFLIYAGISRDLKAKKEKF